MSAAVAQRPVLPEDSSPALPHAVSEDLLETLLASCRKPAAPLPGFGRELTPFYAPAKPTASAKAATTRGNPQRGHRKAAVAAAALVAAAKKASNKHSSGKVAAKAVVTEPNTQAKSPPTTWAGPGFFLSPPPAQLPMPSDGLLGTN